MSNRTVRISKFMSLVLRHDPRKIGIELDEAGWVSVEALLKGMAEHGKRVSREQLEAVVRDNDKQRFSFSEDGTQIRANQGHSVEVELGCERADPPATLYHGTVAKFLDSIREKGLLKGQRHHVHLSKDRQTAERVGARRGKPVLLEVDAAAMQAQGVDFFLSKNGVWLTEHVPHEYIRYPERSHHQDQSG